VYGVNQRYDAYGNVIPIFANRLLTHKPLLIYGDGEQTRDFVDVEDVARSNWMALERGVTGIFNIGSGVATTIKDLADMMLKISGNPVDLLYQPPRPGEVRHSRANIAYAGTAFGYAPAVSLTQGLSGYLEWTKSHG
jgi:UDP-glucose 4-epimerase